MTDQWVSVVFAQGEDYEEVRDLGIQEMAEYLAQWDFGQETDDVHIYNEKPWGSCDREHHVTVGGTEYVLTYSNQYGYASLNRRPLCRL